MSRIFATPLGEPSHVANAEGPSQVPRKNQDQIQGAHHVLMISVCRPVSLARAILSSYVGLLLRVR